MLTSLALISALIGVDTPAAAEPSTRVTASPATATPAAAPTSSQPPKVTLAVMDLTTGNGVDPQLAQSVGATLTGELESLGVFEAISSSEIRALVEKEIQLQQSGCATTTCIAELAGALGAEFTIYGSLLKLDQAFLLQLQLVNTAQVRIVQRIEKEYTGGPAGLFDAARASVRILVRDLLELRSGMLSVDVSEVGATIKFDGYIIGVSPLAPVQAAGGVHTLTVEKQGFVLFSRDVSVAAKETTRVGVELLPSDDYRQAYIKGANRDRLIAWLTSAGGGALLATSIGLAAYSGVSTGALNDDIRTYNADPSLQTPGEESRLLGRKSELSAINVTALVVAALGVVSGGVGVYYFLTGDDPDRLDAQTSAGLEATSVTPLIGPRQLGLQVRF